MCGLVQDSRSTKAFIATLLVDPPTTALLINRKRLLAIAPSTNTHRETMAYRSCCLFFFCLLNSV